MFKSIKNIFKWRNTKVNNTTPSVNTTPEEITPVPGDPVKDLKDVVYYIIGVLFIGFIALVITVIFGFGAWYASYTAEKSTSYQNLADKINILIEQNNKIAEDEKSIRISELEKEIKNLRTKNPYLK